MEALFHEMLHRLGQIAARGDNIERFLMGRQVFIISNSSDVLMSGLCCLPGVLCRKADDNPREITRWLSLPSSGSCPGFEKPPDTMAQFNPQTLLLETGLLACVVVVIVAQLTPQIIASVYPVRDYTFYSFLFVCSVEKFQTGLIETLLAQRRLELKTALFLYQ